MPSSIGVTRKKMPRSPRTKRYSAAGRSGSDVKKKSSSKMEKGCTSRRRIKNKLFQMPRSIRKKRNVPVRSTTPRNYKETASSDSDAESADSSDSHEWENSDVDSYDEIKNSDPDEEKKSSSETFPTCSSTGVTLKRSVRVSLVDTYNETELGSEARSSESDVEEKKSSSKKGDTTKGVTKDNEMTSSSRVTRERRRRSTPAQNFLETDSESEGESTGPAVREKSSSKRSRGVIKDGENPSSTRLTRKRNVRSTPAKASDKDGERTNPGGTAATRCMRNTPVKNYREIEETSETASSDSDVEKESSGSDVEEKSSSKKRDTSRVEITNDDEMNSSTGVTRKSKRRSTAAENFKETESENEAENTGSDVEKEKSSSMEGNTSRVPAKNDAEIRISPGVTQKRKRRSSRVKNHEERELEGEAKRESENEAESSGSDAKKSSSKKGDMNRILIESDDEMDSSIGVTRKSKRRSTMAEKSKETESENGAENTGSDVEKEKSSAKEGNTSRAPAKNDDEIPGSTEVTPKWNGRNSRPQTDRGNETGEDILVQLKRRRVSHRRK